MALLHEELEAAGQKGKRSGTEAALNTEGVAKKHRAMQAGSTQPSRPLSMPRPLSVACVEKVETLNIPVFKL